MFWRKKKPEVIHVIHEVGAMDDLTDDQLFERCHGLFNTAEWTYFIEKIRRERSRLVAELAYSENHDQLGRIQGRVKAYDWLITISNTNANSLT